MSARIRHLSRRRTQRGAAVVEFALVAGVFFMLLIGIVEFGRVLYYWNTASEVARLAARTAAVCSISDASSVKTRARALLPLLSNANISISYTSDSVAGTCTASDCEFVTVTLSNVQVPTLIPFMHVVLTMPPFSTTIPRESLQTQTVGGTNICQ